MALVDRASQGACITAANNSVGKGFERYAIHPASIAALRVVSLSFAVMKMTGISNSRKRQLASQNYSGRSVQLAIQHKTCGVAKVGVVEKTSTVLNNTLSNPCTFRMRSTDLRTLGSSSTTGISFRGVTSYHLEYRLD
jgi:hypothetical protein